MVNKLKGKIEEICILSNKIKSKEIIKNSIKDVLRLKGVEIRITDFEAKAKLRLGMAFSDIDYFIQRVEYPMGLNLELLLSLLEREAKVTPPPHYNFFITEKELFIESYAERLSPFGGYSKHAVVISLNKLKDFGRKTRNQLIRQLTYYFFGRLLGIPNKERNSVEKVYRDLSCTNICSMRRPVLLEDLVKYAKQRVRVGRIYCEACEEDLKKI